MQGWRIAAAVLLLTMLSTAAAVARDPDPAFRVPLAPLGYQTLMRDFLLAGSSMLTVDFVDKDHLLITFGLRRLMQREADPPANDDDQTIGAFLVELPSGKLLARTEWRLHDRLQYLWNIGDGRFLLRVRDELTMLAPLRSAAGDEFRQIPLLQINRHIVAIRVSADGDLLTVVTTSRAAGAGEASDGFGGALTPGDPTPLRTNFFRLQHRDSAGLEDGKLRVVSAGAIRSRSPILLPMTAAGVLDVLDGGKGTYLFNFEEHAGKSSELLAFDSTCVPRATFVAQSEFVVMGCRGSDQRQDIAGFNLKGDQMWQQNFTDQHVTPTYSFAPAAGRFALGRTIVNGALDPDAALSAGSATAQEVRVYQTYTGRLLLRMECSPIERAGQNFALSPDGLRLGVIRETLLPHKSTKDTEAYVERSAAVEIYALPPLTPKDLDAVKGSQAVAPVDTGARIDASLARLSTRAAAAAAAKSGAAKTGKSADMPTATAAPPETDAGMGTGTPSTTGLPASTKANEGDVETDGPRKPPTLYGPDEKPVAKHPK